MLMIFASTLRWIVWQRISSALVYPEMSAGALCIFAMQSLSGTESLMFMKVIELVRIPGLMKESLKTMTFEPESSSCAPCLMAKGAKEPDYSSFESSDDESDDDNFEPSYSKLANIAVEQQKALEKVQNLLDKSDDLLGEELDKTQTNDLKRLQSKFYNLQSHHNSLLTDHEKLLMNFFKESKILGS
jgi:hypothetical protein